MFLLLYCPQSLIFPLAFLNNFMDLIFLSYFFAFPALVLILLQMSGFSLLRLGLIQFVTIRLLFFSFIGTLPLFFGFDRRLNSGIDDPNLVLKVMLFSSATILS